MKVIYLYKTIQLYIKTFLNWYKFEMTQIFLFMFSRCATRFIMMGIVILLFEIIALFFPVIDKIIKYNDTYSILYIVLLVIIARLLSFYWCNKIETACDNKIQKIELEYKVKHEIINNYSDELTNTSIRYALVKLEKKHRLLYLLLVANNGTFSFSNEIEASTECEVYTYIRGYLSKIGHLVSKDPILFDGSYIFVSSYNRLYKYTVDLRKSELKINSVVMKHNNAIEKIFNSAVIVNFNNIWKF